MGTISVDADNAGLNDVRAFGEQYKVLTGTYAFDSSYPTDGEAFDLGDYFPKEVINVLFEPQAGYIFRYDASNKKVLAYEPLTTPTGTVSQPGFTGSVVSLQASSGETYTVVDDDAPGGNAVYLKFTTGGTPYICCNLANETADAFLDFGNDIKIRLVHDGSASGGTQIYFDEDGTQPDRLLADLSSGLNDNVYVKSNVPGYVLKVKNDGSADTNGVALNYDDDTDDQLEATTDGDANADLQLAEVIPNGTVAQPSFSGNEVATHAEADNEDDLASLDTVKFVAWGY